MQITNPAATVMDVTFSNFDFNMHYMKFITGLFTSAHSAGIAKLADDMRIWGMARSANPKTSVQYQVRTTLRAAAILNGSEFISIKTDEVLRDDENLLSVMLASFLPEDWDGLAEPVAPLKALALYDTALNLLKAELGDVNRSAYVSLRHQIASAARMATQAQVQDESITFAIHDDKMVHVFKVVIPHVAPGKVALQAA